MSDQNTVDKERLVFDILAIFDQGVILPDETEKVVEAVRLVEKLIAQAEKKAEVRGRIDNAKEILERVESMNATDNWLIRDLKNGIKSLEAELQAQGEE